jgi:hypothetical protein
MATNKEFKQAQNAFESAWVRFCKEVLAKYSPQIDSKLYRIKDDFKPSNPVQLKVVLSKKIPCFWSDNEIIDVIDTPQYLVFATQQLVDCVEG